MLKKNILPFLSFFGLLLLCQFWRLKDPFFNDELIYSIKNFENASFSIFIPFSGSYVSHTGHPPFLPFLSYLVFKSGVPFIPGLRIIYLLFSSFFLFSFFETLQLITKNKKASLVGVFLLFFNPVFFTHSAMIMGNIPEASLALFSLNQLFKKKKWLIAPLFFWGIFIRESFLGIGGILYLWLIQKEKKSYLKFYYFLPGVLLLFLFYYGEKVGTGEYLNHSYAVGGMDHGDFSFSLYSLLTSFKPLPVFYPDAVWFVLLFCCFSLKKIEKEKCLAFIMLSSLFLPYLIFFGLYGDTQTRDFFLLLPITTTLIVLTMESFSQQWKKILLICFILFYQAFDFNKVQDKETLKYRETYQAYQEVLDYLDENPNVKNNLESQFPYKLIFKEKEFGVLQGRAPIQSGSELYVILETEEKSDSLFEVKVFKNSNKRIAIKLVN